MSVILKGAPVVAAMNEANAARCAALREKGVVPTLAVVRVGAREDDLSYEKGVMARCAKVGVEVKQFLSLIHILGIHVNEEGKLCGDVRFGEAEPLVEAITPVPGGVGTVTTSVLVSHVVEAAEKTA